MKENIRAESNYRTIDKDNHPRQYMRKGKPLTHFRRVKSGNKSTTQEPPLARVIKQHNRASIFNPSNHSHKEPSGRKD